LADDGVAALKTKGKARSPAGALMHDQAAKPAAQVRLASRGNSPL